ncbi:MAG: hypothetical protein JWN36_1701 [Microbacteriaceae bacterium]|nr:hypothetical protein [Microbacteriaceae bacterium]
MGDGLTIGGGGSIAVGTDELLEAAGALREMTDELARCGRELASIDRIVSEGQLRAADAPISALDAERLMDDAAFLARAAEFSGARLHTALDLSADAYGVAERAAEAAAERLAGAAAYALGFAMPALAVDALPLLLGVGVMTAAIAALPKDVRTKVLSGAAAWFKQHSSVLSSPLFAQAVRLTVTSVDDFTAGAAHLPPGLDRALQDAGLIGVGTSTAGVIAVGSGLGYLAETPITTTRASTTDRFTAPTGWEDRASRVPRGDAQVRIDKYEEPDGSARFEVYISGTRDFALGHDDQPWDMTSNLHGIAGGDSGSIEATRQAMADAGIDANTPVVITGHSQGGLVAARIAGSGDYNVQALYTLGAPAAQATVPSSVPWVAVEHTNDIVPALSGSWTHSDPVLVRRELYTDGPVPHDNYFPSHQLGAYEQTSALLDESTEPRVTAVADRFDDFVKGATPVESTTWESVRQPPVSGGG